MASASASGQPGKLLGGRRQRHLPAGHAPRGRRGKTAPAAAAAVASACVSEGRFSGRACQVRLRPCVAAVGGHVRLPAVRAGGHDRAWSASPNATSSRPERSGGRGGCLGWPPDGPTGPRYRCTTPTTRTPTIAIPTSASARRARVDSPATASALRHLARDPGCRGAGGAPRYTVVCSSTRFSSSTVSPLVSASRSRPTRSACVRSGRLPRPPTRVPAWH